MHAPYVTLAVAMQNFDFSVMQLAIVRTVLLAEAPLHHKVGPFYLSRSWYRLSSADCRCRTSFDHLP